MDRLDQYVEQVLLPAYTRGVERRKNNQYHALRGRAYYYRKQGDHTKATELDKQRRQMPERDPNDPEYRRLRYLRYADDFCLGFAGPKVEAEQIKAALKDFLQESLKLELLLTSA